MTKIFENIIETVGNTPLVRIHHMPGAEDVAILPSSLGVHPFPAGSRVYIEPKEIDHSKIHEKFR